MQRISEVSHRTTEGTSQARNLIEDLSRSCRPLQGLLGGETVPKTQSTVERPFSALLTPKFVNRLAPREQPA